ncbi:MAG: Si-specific NAD(P)(+) transhydrogenase [Polyangiaceae bacterium]|nr:Si-specific NAD(P)(+) transhydrogenase [Polyangiaceae bacterium]
MSSLLLSSDGGYYPRHLVTFDYDLVVIGSGPAGERGAVTAASLGKRVLVVEKAAEPGGAAVHTGTLPSKTLRETALFLSGRDQREVYGVGVTIDDDLFVPKLLSRKAAVKRLEVERIRRAFKDAGVELVRGSARVSGANKVHIDLVASPPSGASHREVSAEFILVATGSYPHRPPEMPWDDPQVEDSDTILDLDLMPARLVVIGAGVIGCEYAAMFAALGVRVTLVDKRNELLAFLDRDMSEALRVSFVSMGIDVRLEDAQERVRRDGDHIVVELKRGGSVPCDMLLFCGGRSGATNGLGLEEAGVKLGLRGSIEVDAHYRSSVPHILAAGDVIGFPALASTSMEQGRLAVLYAFGKQDEIALSSCSSADVAKMRLPYGIYTIPEVSCVGFSEEDAIAEGREVVVGKGDFEHNARAKINGFSQGFVKLVFDKKTRVCIGAHAIGDRATELIHIGQACVALGGTVDTMSGMVFNYPTLSECFKHAARDALSRWL